MVSFGKRTILVLITVLLVNFLLISCQVDEGEEFRNVQFIPVGVWEDGWGGSYIITRTKVYFETKVYFDDGFGFIRFNGTIEAAIDFSRNSGVLIVKINSSETDIIEGNYIGVYYRNYTSSHILLANAIDEHFDIIQVASFGEAKRLFNAGNVSTHVTFWGSGYTR
ncbi:MAG: hypothetical protein FWC97_04730 [Treponema sp.]|nr:hypothetical protein [Treponema sp.]